MVPVAPNATVEEPALNVAFAALEVQLPLSVIVEAFAVSVPFAPIVRPAIVTARLLAPVVRTVFPVGLAALLWRYPHHPKNRGRSHPANGPPNRGEALGRGKAGPPGARGGDARDHRASQYE